MGLRGSHLGVRLNVLSDLSPKIMEPIIKAHPDVSFYDYTKMNYDPVADNHHYTYSSTGLSQPDRGVENPFSNWRKARDRLDQGRNVAMAFAHGKSDAFPKHLHDEETGKKYRVVSGDEHDFRPMDMVPEGEAGVIIALKNMAASNFDSWMQVVTFVSVALVAVMTRGMVQRLLILVGLIVASIIYAVLTNGLGLGKPIDFSGVANAAWFGMPSFAAPVFSAQAMLLIAPVAIILVAENLGHIKAVTAMTGKNLDQYMGRAFMGDGVATMVAGSAGGTGVTTYAENIGVMAATKIYSTAIFLIAGIMAVVLGFSPKFGALIQAIPLPVMGGVSIVVFGLIAVAGAKIWVDNKVDFSDNRNLIVAAVTLILGTGDYTLKFGAFALGGIGTATFGAILLYALLGRRS